MFELSADNTAMAQKNAVEKQQQNDRAIRFLETIEDSYTVDARFFARFLRENKLPLSWDSIEMYIEWLALPHQGKRYSASTYNKKVSAVKKRVRELFEHSADQSDRMKAYHIEKKLKNIKLKKTEGPKNTADRVPSKEEMKVLLANAPYRLGLQIRFLGQTGLRISEMLNLLVADCKVQKNNVRLRVLGKGNKERTIHMPSVKLFKRIREEFRGKTYLFEHDGRQYDRIATTQRIGDLAEKTIGKRVTAHGIRHRFATDMTNDHGVHLSSKYIGHASVQTTVQYYYHGQATPDDIAQTVSYLEEE